MALYTNTTQVRVISGSGLVKGEGVGFRGSISTCATSSHHGVPNLIPLLKPPPFPLLDYVFNLASPPGPPHLTFYL